MLLSPRQNGLASLFKEVRVFKEPQNPKSAFESPKNAILDPLENRPKSQLKVQKRPFWGNSIPQNGLFEHLIDFWGHFSGGVQNGIFRTFKCTFGVLGFQGSVA